MPALPAVIRRPWVVLGARTVVGGVFLLAAIPKLFDPASFAEDISNYQLLPESLVPALAVALPVIEMTIAAALLTGVQARGAAVLAAGLLAVFIAAMAHTMVEGIDLECGCFGNTTQSSVGWEAIVRNLGLVGASALVVIAPATPWRTVWRRPENRSAPDRSP